MSFFKTNKFSYLSKKATFLLAVPVALAIITHVEKKSLLFMLQRWEFYLAWACNVILVFLVLRFTIWCNRVLDHYFPWHTNSTKRFYWQIGYGVGLSLLLAFLLSAGYFAIRQRNIFSTGYFRRYFLLEAVMLFAFNMLCYFLYKQRGIKPIRTSDLMPDTLPVPVANIAFVQLKDGISTLYEASGEATYVAVSISKISEMLPSSDFYFINRWTIVQRNAIFKVKARKRCLQLELRKPLEVMLEVSARETPGFKRWMKQVE